MLRKIILSVLLASCSVWAQTNAFTASNATGTNAPVLTPAQRGEEIRTLCINHRRQICGRVVQITPDALIVESGYTSLLRPPLNQSWVVRGNVYATRDASAVEGRTPGTPCIGTVLLSDFPRKPAVKLYDYVILMGYPTGEYEYVPVPPVHKTIRRYAGSLARAVQRTLDAGEKK